MDLLLLRHYSWLDLLLAAVLLYAGYLLLLFLRGRLERSKRATGARATIYGIVAPFLLLYEPITVLLLATMFIFINPLLHGTLLLLVVALGFTRLRDYFSGRIVLFNPLVAKGKRLKVDRFNGVVNRISRVGLYLQTGEGLHFVNYTTLLTQGYSVVTGKDIGGFYQLRIHPTEQRDDGLQELADRFLTTPYLDRTFRPELSYASDAEARIRARVSVREEQHLNELLDLLTEWGFPATIAKR